MLSLVRVALAISLGYYLTNQNDAIITIEELLSHRIVIKQFIFPEYNLFFTSDKYENFNQGILFEERTE